MKYNLKWTFKNEKNLHGDFFSSIIIVDEDKGINDEVLKQFSSAIITIIGSGSNKLYENKTIDEKTNIASNIKLYIHKDFLDELILKTNVLEEKGFIYVKN